MFYYTRNHVWEWNKIISAAKGVLQLLFQNYHRDKEHVGKYSRAAASLQWNNFEIISGKFPRAEIKLFRTVIDEGWNTFEIILFHTHQPQHDSKLTRFPSPFFRHLRLLRERVQVEPGSLSYFRNTDAKVFSFQNNCDQILEVLRRFAIFWKVRPGKDQLYQPLVICVVERQLPNHLSISHTHNAQASACHCVCSTHANVTLALPQYMHAFRLRHWWDDPTYTALYISRHSLTDIDSPAAANKPTVNVKWCVYGLTSHSTHYGPFRGQFLQARWPNQQCQRTEGNPLVVKDQSWIPPEPLHHVTIIQLYSATASTHSVRVPMWQTQSVGPVSTLV